MGYCPTLPSEPAAGWSGTCRDHLKTPTRKVFNLSSGNFRTCQMSLSYWWPVRIWARIMEGQGFSSSQKKKGILCSDSVISLRKCWTSRPNLCHSSFHWNENRENEEGESGCPSSVLSGERCSDLSDAFPPGLGGCFLWWDTYHLLTIRVVWMTGDSAYAPSILSTHLPRLLDIFLGKKNIYSKKGWL